MFAGLVRPELVEDSRLKDAYDALNEVRELGQRWEERFTFQNPALAKRYFEGEICVDFELSIGRRDGFLKDYRAVFERELVVSGLHGERRGIDRIGGPRGVENRDRLGEGVVVGPYRNEKVMLVFDVELVQPPKLIAPSLVWLERLEQPDGPGGCSLYLSINGPEKFLGGIAYGKRGAIARRPVVVENDPVGEQIERGSEIMEDVAENQSPSDWDFLSDAELMEAATCLGIVMGFDYIGFTCTPRRDLVVEVKDVLVGPVNL